MTTTQRDNFRKALGSFAAAARNLQNAWGDMGSDQDTTGYPQGWADFDEIADNIEAWCWSEMESGR